MGVAAALTCAALSVLFGCQSASKTVAVPPTTSVTPSGSTGGLGTPSDSTNPGGTTTAPDPVAGTSPTNGTPTDPTTPSQPNPTTPTTPTASASGPITLRLSIDKGSKMTYKTESESSQKMGSQNGKMPEPKPVKSTSETTVDVVDVSGGKSKVEISVSKMKLSGGMDNEAAKKAMEKMAQDSEGVKVSVLFDSLAQPSNLQYLKGSKAQAASAGIETDTGFFGISYPEKPVKPGDTWTHKFDFKEAIGAMGPTKGTTWKDTDVTTVFTLRSIDQAAGTAVIGIEAKGSPSMKLSTAGIPKDKASPDMPKEIAMNFSVAGSGSAIVDLKTGAPREINYQMNVEFKSPMGVMGQSTKASLKRIN